MSPCRPLRLAAALARVGRGARRDPFRGRARSLTRLVPVKVGRDVHAWMSAWVLVVETPFSAVSDAEGRFTIPGVPPGRHTAIAWHERLGEKIATVNVPANGPATLDLAYS